jgi:hypothetical protein
MICAAKWRHCPPVYAASTHSVCGCSSAVWEVYRWSVFSRANISYTQSARHEQFTMAFTVHSEEAHSPLCVCVCVCGCSSAVWEVSRGIQWEVYSGRYPEVYSGRYTVGGIQRYTVGGIQWEIYSGRYPEVYRAHGMSSSQWRSKCAARRHEQFTMAIKVRSKVARAVHNGVQSAQQEARAVHNGDQSAQQEARAVHNGDQSAQQGGTSSSQWRSKCAARRHTPLCLCVCVYVCMCVCVCVGHCFGDGVS